MSTYLELCADLARESGAIGTAPSAVTGQTGRQLKAVEWIASAWEQIQADNLDWLFMRKEFSGTLSPNVMQYTAEALGITDLAEWVTDYTGHQAVSLYPVGEQAKETPLRLISHEYWRRTYNFGTHTASQPCDYAIVPGESLAVGPKPDIAYTIRGEYYRTPQVLAANGDIPIAPARFHPIIVWRALMMLCDHDEAWNAYTAAERKYRAVLRNMQRDLLPAFTTGGNSLG